MNASITSRAAMSGALATLVYPVVVVALQVGQRPQYHPMSQAISELALGRGGWLMAVAFCSLAAGTAVLARLVWALTAARVATVLLAASAGLTLLSAFVHADGPAVHGTTLHGAIHQIAGVLTFAMTIVAMFLVARRLRRRPQWGTASRITAVLGCTGVVAFFLVPMAGTAHFGLVQRVLVGLLVAWVAGMQLYAARLAAGRTGVQAAAADASAR